MMFRNKKSSVFIVFLSLALACSSPSSEQAKTSESSAETDDNPSSEEQHLAMVVEGYLLLKDALVASNFQEAQAKATNLLEVIDATNMMNVQQSSKQIAAATDLDSQRVYFDSLSTYLYSYVEAESGEEHTLYKQYCPMAFDNRGAFWLSNAQEIRNPYFGDEMLKCGRVEEEIQY